MNKVVTFGEITPVGGVSTEESNLKAWFDAGITCVGMGSKLKIKDLIAKGDFERLSKEVKSTLAIIQRLQSNH